MPQAVLLVFSVAEGALASDGVGPRQRDVLLQQHGQDLVVIPVGSQDDGGHVHGGGVLWVLDPLHQFLQQNCFSQRRQRRNRFGNVRTLTAIEGLEDRRGLWLRRMSTAPTTSESMATNRASVAWKQEQSELDAAIKQPSLARFTF